MLRAIGLAFAQLLHPATLRLMLFVAVVSAAIAGLIGVIAAWLLFEPVLAWAMAHFGWHNAGDVALLCGLLLGWLLFRAVAMAVMGLVIDRVIASVEQHHYPHAAARAVSVSLRGGVALGLRSAGRAIGWNLVAMPLYILLLVTGAGTIILAVAVNTLVLGRDFEDMVAARHPTSGTRPFAPGERLVAGLAPALLFCVPFASLAAPVFGAALAVHLLSRQRERSLA